MSICTMNDYKNDSLTNNSKRSLVYCRNECYQEGHFPGRVQQQERDNRFEGFTHKEGEPVPLKLD